MPPARPLTLETYHSFFLHPWNTSITVDQLNQILYMHGFAKFCHLKSQNKPKKAKIMELVVGQVDLMPPRRTTLHDAALSVASPPHSAAAAVITAAQARDDLEAIGWAEFPIGSVASFPAPSADAPEEPVERVPRRADFVIAGRRPRSKRTRGSAYRPRDVAAAESMNLKADAPRKQAKVIVKEGEKEPEPELVSPPPPPPLWTRSPTPPPPASPPPPRDVAPPPPPACQPQPTLAPIPAPPALGTPMVRPHPSQQLFWGLPVPCPETLPPGWSVPTPPPSFPAPFWGAPVMLPPLPPHVAWRWPPTTAPHPTIQLQRPPPPLLLPHPPPHFQGQPLPGLLRAPPPPTLQHYPPPHFGWQHPPPALHQEPPPMQLLQRPPH